MMRKKTVNLLQYAFFLGLGIFLLWYSANNLSAENQKHLTEAFQTTNYWLAIPVMGLLMISHFSRALRWRILIRPLGYNPSVTNMFIATLLGYFFNLLVPRLGEVMKCTILAKQEKIPADKVIGTMVTERACDFLALIIIIIVTISIQFETIQLFAATQFHGIFYNDKGQLKIYKLLIIISLIALLIIIILRIAKIFAHAKFIQSIKKILKGIWLGISSIRHMEDKWLFLFHTLFIWAIYFFSIRLGFHILDAVADLGTKASFAILSFGSIAMLATQGGIGAYQYTIQKLLPLYGIEEGPALAFGWILWIAQTGIIIFAGIVCLILLPVINRKKHETSGFDQ